ncbi:hypothetical protein Vadar_023552 [Vaccinium darrowii]|uniref:Uncharacterized protein n=1 Tax=Vaccinium darrowii TaxID=229202 RepID=A0ACB7ZDT0_9ERIC|nr:hypothetical protein Vadar_023552 [Vaccinium darrowii]
MEESQEILPKSLANSGVTIPPDVSSIRDLTPATLYEILKDYCLTKHHYCYPFHQIKPSPLPVKHFPTIYQIKTVGSTQLAERKFNGDSRRRPLLNPSP